MKYFLIFVAFSLILSNPVNAKEHQVIVDVNGLVCDFCARALEKVFSKQEEVAKIDVDLAEKNIIVYFNDNAQLDDAVITKLINDSGYSVVSINHDSGLDND